MSLPHVVRLMRRGVIPTIASALCACAGALAASDPAPAEHSQAIQELGRRYAGCYRAQPNWPFGLRNPLRLDSVPGRTDFERSSFRVWPTHPYRLGRWNVQSGHPAHGRNTNTPPNGAAATSAAGPSVRDTLWIEFTSGQGMHDLRDYAGGGFAVVGDTLRGVMHDQTSLNRVDAPGWPVTAIRVSCSDEAKAPN
jgi:hypothetical protein